MRAAFCPPAGDKTGGGAATWRNKYLILRDVAIPSHVLPPMRHIERGPNGRAAQRNIDCRLNLRLNFMRSGSGK